MTDEQYFAMCNLEGAIQLAHPDFDESFHEAIWKQFPVTCIICQRQTKEFTQIAIESLLRFYPYIKILVMDGDSEDQSTLYLKYKELTTENLTVYNYVGRNSHGEILDFAIRNLVDTPLVMTFDSDVIVRFGGFIEKMVEQFSADDNLYATGSLMLVSHSNYGVGTPKDENDVLRYAHPSASMYRSWMYKELGAANDNGAPFGQNMRDAAEKKLTVAPFPIDYFIQHRCGSSWVKEHKIVWPSDHGVFLRPFATFLVSDEEQLMLLQSQKDKDFNIVMLGDNTKIRIWETTTRDIDNPYYEIRFQCNGEYVVIFGENVSGFDENMVTSIKQFIIDLNAPEKIERSSGMKIYERKYFQNEIALF